MITSGVVVEVVVVGDNTNHKVISEEESLVVAGDNTNHRAGRPAHKPSGKNKVPLPGLACCLTEVVKNDCV